MIRTEPEKKEISLVAAEKLSLEKLCRSLRNATIAGVATMILTSGTPALAVATSSAAGKDPAFCAQLLLLGGGALELDHSQIMAVLSQNLKDRFLSEEGIAFVEAHLDDIWALDVIHFDLWRIDPWVLRRDLGSPRDRTYPGLVLLRTLKQAEQKGKNGFAMMSSLGAQEFLRLFLNPSRALLLPLQNQAQHLHHGEKETDNLHAVRLLEKRIRASIPGWPKPKPDDLKILTWRKRQIQDLLGEKFDQLFRSHQQAPVEFLYSRLEDVLDEIPAPESVSKDEPIAFPVSAAAEIHEIAADDPKVRGEAMMRNLYYFLMMSLFRTNQPLVQVYLKNYFLALFESADLLRNGKGEFATFKGNAKDREWALTYLDGLLRLYRHE